MARSYTRRLNIYVNGKEVENNIYSIRTAWRSLKKDIESPLKPGFTEDDRKKWIKDYRTLDAILVDHRKNLRQNENAIKRMANAFNKYWPMVMGTLGFIGGMAFSVKKLTDEFAQFDDKLKDVIKTTGLTEQQARRLDRQLLKEDSRTARDEMLDMAYVAGKLGLTLEEEILGFIRASDKIVVALKKDLGGSAEEAINTIGKLVQVFGLREEFGMEEAMLRVGSAINELGMASAASEKNIVNFAKRAAGLGNLANIQVPDILGLGASIDALALSMEVSSTAYGMFLGRMAKDTATFANMAGMKLDEYVTLLNEDANEAFLRVLEAVNNSGEGFISLRGAMDEAGLSGQRAVQVISTLAQQTDFIREQQELARREYALGTSVINEFNIKNNSAQAIIEKNQKKIKELKVALGEELMPVYISGQKTIMKFFNTLSTFTQFIFKHSKAFTSAATVIIAYTLALKLIINPYRALRKSAALAKTAIDVNSKSVSIITVFMYAFRTAIDMVNAGATRLAAVMTALKISMGGIVSILIALASGITTYLMLNRKAKEETFDTVKRYNELIKENQRYALEEQTQLKLTTKLIYTTNMGSEYRVKLIKDLIKQYPVYLSHIKAEEASNNDLKEALKGVNSNITKRLELQKLEARAQAQRERIVESYKRQLEIEEDMQAFQRRVDDIEQKNADKNLKTPEKIAKHYKKLINALQIEYDKNAASIIHQEELLLLTTIESTTQRKKIANEYNAVIQKQINTLAEERQMLEENTELTGVNHQKRILDIDREIKRLKRHLREKKEILHKEDEFSKEKEVEEKNREHQKYAQGLIDQHRYQQNIRLIELKYMEGRLDTIEMTALEEAELMESIWKKKIEINEAEIKNNKDTNSIKLKNDKQFKEDSLKLLQDFNDGTISTQREYQDKLLQLEIDSLTRMLKLYNESSDEYLDIQLQLHQKLREQLEREQKYNKELQDAAITDEIEKENLRYQRKKDDLGLHLLEEEKMTKEQKQALQGIEEEHTDKLRDIYYQKVKDELDSLNRQYKAEMALIRATATAELQAHNTRSARQRITREQREKEAKLTAEYADTMSNIFKTIEESGVASFLGLTVAVDLADKQIEQLLEKLTEMINNLGRLRPRINEIRVGTKDFFGFSMNEWDQFIENIFGKWDKETKTWEGSLWKKLPFEEKMATMGLALITFGNLGKEIYSTLDAYEQRALDQFAERNNEQKEILQKRLDMGLISHEYYNDQLKTMDKELDKKRAEFARQQAKRDKNIAMFEAAIQGGVAVITAFAKNPVLGAIVAALVASKTAMIAAKPLPEIPGAETGRYIFVQRAQDKKKYRAEYAPDKRGLIRKPTILTGENNKPEYVVPSDGLKNPTLQPLIHAIETARLNKNLRTVNFDNLLFKQIYNSKQQGGYTTIEKHIPAATPKIVNQINLTELTTLINEHMALMKKIDEKLDKPFKGIVALHGDTGIYKAMELDKRITENANL